MQSTFLNAIRNFEGYTPRAQWDYAQNSNGYGTKALYPGEAIDRREAEKRFRSEIGHAQSQVEHFAPKLDSGTKAALTSLTYNAGTKWMRSGLGQAIRDGDLETARSLFLQYNKAGGEVLPGLVSRRTQEAAWIASPVGGTGPAHQEIASVTTDQMSTARSPPKPELANSGAENLSHTTAGASLETRLQHVPDFLMNARRTAHITPPSALPLPGPADANRQLEMATSLLPLFNAVRVSPDASALSALRLVLDRSETEDAFHREHSFNRATV